MTTEGMGRLRSILDNQKIDAVLVTNLVNVRYLCGYTGTEGTLLVTRRAAYFFTDSRYTEQAKVQVKGARIVIFKDKNKSIGLTIRRLAVARMGIEGDTMTVNFRSRLAAILPAVKIKALANEINQLRICKNDDEVQALRAAIALSEKALKKVLKKLKPGVREVDFARWLDIEQLRLGAEGNSFDTIVASGYRGALPHGVASEKTVRDGELVVIDYGAVLAGYYSDQTVTIPVGKSSRLQKKVYQVVYDAQRAAIDVARPGMTGAELDRVARRVIDKAGYGSYFGHGLGHGVGLEIHEGPRASSQYPHPLQPGMIVTIEPGIYLPGKFGVRLEDMIMITDAGCEVLTTLDKKWQGN